MGKRRHSRTGVALAGALFSFATLVSAGGETATKGSARDHAAVFERIRALAGDWEGSFAWSGARTSTGKMQATYYATAGGTAVVENLSVGREPTMTSVYHMDGEALRMTHYCMAGNQPRLRATNVGDGAGQVTFMLVDVTNLAGPKAPHVQQLEIQFVDLNHIVLTFGFGAESGVSYERIDLLRARQAPSKS